jgi:hypothetical protein
MKPAVTAFRKWAWPGYRDGQYVEFFVKELTPQQLIKILPQFEFDDRTPIVIKDGGEPSWVFLMVISRAQATADPPWIAIHYPDQEKIVVVASRDPGMRPFDEISVSRGGF